MQKSLKLTTAVFICLGATLPLSEARFFDPPHTISILHMHSKEQLTITYKRDGRYDKAALDKLNWLLRDWRRDEPTKMDPRLFDLLWEVTKETGTEEPIHVVSAYRSPQTNEMLRERSRGVAKFSQHTMGRAMDFYLPDVPLWKIRYLGVKKQLGGVGFYPTSGSPFVHLDVGNIRAWPRLTHDQLSNIFPNGETVHLPADGKPLPGYEAALERLGKDGKNGPERVAEYGDQTVRGLVNGSPGGGFFSRSKNLFTALFGGSDDDDSDSDPTPAVVPDQKLKALQNLAAKKADDDEEAPAKPIQQPTVVGGIPVPAPRLATGQPIALAENTANAPIRPVERPVFGGELPRATITDPIEPHRAIASAIPIPTPRLVWEQGPQGVAIKTPSIGEAPIVQASIAGKPIPKPRPGAIRTTVAAVEPQIVKPIQAEKPAAVEKTSIPEKAPVAAAPEPEEKLTWAVGAPAVRTAPPTRVDTVSTTRLSIKPGERVAAKADKGKFAKSETGETAAETLLAAKPLSTQESFSHITTVDKSGTSSTTFR